MSKEDTIDIDLVVNKVHERCAKRNGNKHALEQAKQNLQETKQHQAEQKYAGAEDDAQAGEKPTRI